MKVNGQLLLNELNAAMISRLATVPGASGMDNGYDHTYCVLKTHLMISSGACKVEPDYAAKDQSFNSRS
jgi:hypothetical protein